MGLAWHWDCKKRSMNTLSASIGLIPRLLSGITRCDAPQAGMMILLYSIEAVL